MVFDHCNYMMVFCMMDAKHLTNFLCCILHVDKQKMCYFPLILRLLAHYQNPTLVPLMTSHINNHSEDEVRILLYHMIYKNLMNMIFTKYFENVMRASLILSISNEKSCR
jgi:hypothetical protein